ncbi:MAG: CAP domain-containing protein [Nanoarchaeota archaeon]|nr:CAP domain-containing protein [Nanoarchaeota archaeon]
MDIQNLKYQFLNWFSYLKNYLHHVFFKLLLLFLLNFIIFGLYFQTFFENNFIVFFILVVIELYLIRNLLWKRAKLTKIFVILTVIILSFLLAKIFASFIFTNFGLNSFISDFGNQSGVSDKLIMAGTRDMLQAGKSVSQEAIQTARDTLPSSKGSAQKAFEYINKLREENGQKAILWDDKIYELAKYKVQDMNDRNYFDHVDPDGECVGDYARDFGLKYPSDSFAENLFGGGSPTSAVDTWMTSRGHRFNLLHFRHVRGAIACDFGNCAFIGQGGDGWVCDTGENGLAFWERAGRQPGEITS